MSNTQVLTSRHTVPVYYKSDKERVIGRQEKNATFENKAGVGKPFKVLAIFSINKRRLQETVIPVLLSPGAALYFVERLLRRCLISKVEGSKGLCVFAVLAGKV